MVGVAEILNVCVTLTLTKTATIAVRRWKRFSIEQLSNDYERLLNDYCATDYQATFPLRRGNFILTATVPVIHTTTVTTYYDYYYFH